MKGSLEWKTEILLNRVVETVAEQFFHVQLCLIRFHVAEARFGSRVLRYEQLAAVLIGNRRNFKSPDTARLIDNFLFIHAHQRAQYRQARRLLDHRHVVEGLRGDLAEALAGNQGFGFFWRAIASAMRSIMRR